MTLFQALIHSVLATLSNLLPIGEGAHREVLPFVLGWPAASPAVKAAVSMGSALGAFLYFWHDWASQLSSLLQIVIFRRRPRTMDEKMPLFILCGTIPAVAGWIYLEPMIPGPWNGPLPIVACLVSGALLLPWLERFSRKNRQIFDWDFRDSFFAGVGELAFLIAGLGRTWGVLIAAFMRNHSRESAGKFALYLSAPVLLLFAIHDVREVSWGQPQADAESTSWLIFGCCLALSLLVSLFSVNALFRSSKREGFATWAHYRWLLALVFAVKLGLNFWQGTA